jgi:N6-adenosine-specific RNA methylase IME4
MNTTQANIARLRQEIASVQQERERRCPYSPRLIHEILAYAVQELAEGGPLYEIGSSLGLAGERLKGWFEEVLEQAAPTELKS